MIIHNPGDDLCFLFCVSTFLAITDYSVIQAQINYLKKKKFFKIQEQETNNLFILFLFFSHFHILSDLTDFVQPCHSFSQFHWLR